MILKVRVPAGRFARFSEEAANSMVGQSFQAVDELSGEKVPVGDGEVVEARVIEDGAALELTVQWPK